MPGLMWTRQFSPEGGPYSDTQWETRDAVIAYGDKVVFKQKNVEVPAGWSQSALNIVAQKYLRGFLDKDGNPGENRETSIRQLVDRVVDTIAGWAGYKSDGQDPKDFEHGLDVYSSFVAMGDEAVLRRHEQPLNGTSQFAGSTGVFVHKRPKATMQKPDEVYFEDRASWEAWRDDLKWLCLNQHFAFNSPVWFNVGLEEHPQCSACFIVKMEDFMVEGKNGDGNFSLDKHGLLAAQVKEGIIFSKGSGSGINLSRVRSSREWLSSGGRPTGPLSFARGLDTWASQIKSGGKTRRAAKMLIMDDDHPDILEFIRVKSKEEKIAQALKTAGFGSDMDSEALQHAFHQNSNLSVRLSDAFMNAAAEGKPWPLISRSNHNLEHLPAATSLIGTPGRVMEELDAAAMLREIGESCWASGDPGVHFANTINQWHTCADEEPIVASNPCSEYLFLDETACNLASLNLRRFIKYDSDMREWLLKTDSFVAAVRIATVAMEVIVSNSKYPTPNFARMSHRYRTLGLGYSNLGGMLMEMGVPYDSEIGRTIAATITSLMTSQAYLMSASIAASLGPFEAFEVNRKSCTRVMRKHAEASNQLQQNATYINKAWEEVQEIATTTWNSVADICANGTGIRNAQASVIAPTGTISFLMDCETTGIEPELALVKWKTLAGGGQLEIINPLVESLLRKAGFIEKEITAISAHLKAGGSIRTSEDFRKLGGLAVDFAEVFRTSFNPRNDDKDFSLSWQAHIAMMAAVQPFVSGAISKTVNMPKESTVKDVIDAYNLAWHSGLKCVAIYRDGSKVVQAVSTDKGDPKSTEETKPAVPAAPAVFTAKRRGLPNMVATVRQKFVVDGVKGFLHAGFYPDWRVGEIFVRMSKAGSTLYGFVDATCRLWSIALQYGAPLEDVVDGFLEVEFEPRGIVENDPTIRSCRSILDYIAKRTTSLQAEAMRRKGLPIIDETVAVVEPSLGVQHLTEPEPKTDEVSTGLYCKNCHRMNMVVRGKCKLCMSCGSEEGGCYA